jgi:hypothetical protein
MRCPGCGSGNFNTESGVEWITVWQDGKPIERSRCKLPRYLSCRDCGFHEDIDKDNPLSHIKVLKRRA